MNLIIALEHRFMGTPDGAVWTKTVYAHAFWSRYLTVFRKVRIVARVHDEPAPHASWQRVDGDSVSVTRVPHYIGPWQYARAYRRVQAAIASALTPGDAVILRVPGAVGSAAGRHLMRTRHPFAVEVVGDPYDVFSPGAIDHPLRRFLRWWEPRNLRRLCASACASLYVTERSLQRRYPPGGFATSASNVELGDHAIRTRSTIGAAAAEAGSAARVDQTGGARERIRLMHIGTFAVPYKAQDVLIRAVAECVEQGCDVELSLVGDGRLRPAMEALACDLGIADRTHFLGSLPVGEPVRAELDRADLFVIPSRTEGMPRALIEAMARGLACIGANVGGIPELLPPEALVPPGDVGALASRIRELAASPGLRAAMGRRNLERAGDYREDVLQRRRVEFYEHLAERTSTWRSTHQAS